MKYMLTLTQTTLQTPTKHSERHHLRHHKAKGLSYPQRWGAPCGPHPPSWGGTGSGSREIPGTGSEPRGSRHPGARPGYDGSAAPRGWACGRGREEGPGSACGQTPGGKVDKEVALDRMYFNPAYVTLHNEET